MLHRHEKKREEGGFGSALRRVAALGVAALATAAIALPTSAFALNIDKEASGLDEDDQTDVTLSIGDATEETTAADVVFVIDHSASMPAKSEALAMLDELYDYTLENDLTVNMGIVTFNGVANDEYRQDVLEPVQSEIAGFNIDLQELNESSYAEFAKLIDSSWYQIFFLHGTNVEAGIREGLKMLEGDTSVSNDNKHLVLVSDGVTYQWGTESEPQTVYVELDNTRAASVDMVNDYYSYRSKNYEAYLDAAQWMQDAYNGGIEDIIDEYQTTYTDASSSSIEPYIPATRECPYSSLECAVYMAGKAWQEAADLGYHLYAYTPDLYAQTYPWAYNFIIGLNTIGDTYTYGYTDDETGVDGMFDNVKNTILHEFESGTVTDVIGDDFDLTDAGNITPDTFALTVGGVAQEATRVEGNTVYFGTPDESGVYPYVVTYEPEAADGETLIWEINVPVESANGVELTYSLTLVNKATEAGDYTVDTNESAVFDYETYDEEAGHGEFPVPSVSYTVPEDEVEPEPEEPTTPGTQEPDDDVTDEPDDTTDDTTGDTTDDTTDEPDQVTSVEQVSVTKTVETKDSGSLPSTGDLATMAVGAAAAAGVLAIGAGAILKRRRG